MYDKYRELLRNGAEDDFFECPNRDRKKQCKWYGSREQLLGLATVSFGRNGINFVCPTCGDAFGNLAYNIRLTSLELDKLALKSPSIDKVESPMNDNVSVTTTSDVDWVQLELDNDFKCIDCETIVETPYFIATDVPGRCSPLLDGPRCKGCHTMVALEREAEKYEYIRFQKVGKKQVWECYSIKYDFFVGDIEYYDGVYVFCAAETNIAFNANTLTDIAAFLAALAPSAGEIV